MKPRAARPPLRVESGPAAEARVDDAMMAASGDRRAFERLYRAHVDRVYSLCIRMSSDRAVAEELTQDVFVRAWEKLASFRGEAQFGTWLHRLAVNVVLNQRKQSSRRQARFDDSEHGVDRAVAPMTRGPGDAMDLKKAIGTLPRGARMVFLLHDVEGYRHEDIAELLGITAGGSKAQLHRARQLLRERLAR